MTLIKWAIYGAAGAVALQLGLSLVTDGWLRMYVHSRKFSFDKIGDLSGKTAIVTGPTYGGLGYVSALELARHGAHVILAGRNAKQGKESMDAIRKELGESAKVEFSELDLSDLASVKSFADRFLASKRPLHILMNNAGVMACPFALSKQGFEMQFATNHLGHFLLTIKLLPVLKSSQPSRIVTTSSAAHYIPEFVGSQSMDVVRASSEATYSPWKAYGRSKLANVLFTTALAERLSGERVYANCLHPGGVATNLQRHVNSSGIMNYITPLFKNLILMSPEQGAYTQLYLAVSPDVETGQGIRGRYFHPPGREVAPSKLVTREAAEELWTLSERLVAELG